MNKMEIKYKAARSKKIRTFFLMKKVERLTQEELNKLISLYKLVPLLTSRANEDKHLTNLVEKCKREVMIIQTRKEKKIRLPKRLANLGSKNCITFNIFRGREEKENNSPSQIKDQIGCLSPRRPFSPLRAKDNMLDSLLDLDYKKAKQAFGDITDENKEVLIKDDVELIYMNLLVISYIIINIINSSNLGANIIFFFEKN